MCDNCRKHILVVDDNKRIRNLLKQFLKTNNFFVTISSCVSEAKKELNKYIFDVIVLDLMMPDESGMSLLTNCQKNNIKIPIIMLTAMDDIGNKTQCFEKGCYDYLSKPFEPQELILRINNILNRQNISVCNFGDFSFNLKTNTLTKNMETIFLTDIETKLLSIFCKNINQPLSREVLKANVINERSVDVAITRLRKKIENDSKKCTFIKTIRNGGYILYS